MRKMVRDTKFNLQFRYKQKLISQIQDKIDQALEKHHKFKVNEIYGLKGVDSLQKMNVEELEGVMETIKDCRL